MAAPVGVGNWEQVLRCLLEKARKTSDLQVFQNCTNDNERIEHLQKKLDLNEFSWIKKYFESCHMFHQKSVERAASERLAGNKRFQKKQYKDAVDSYTNAIIQGPSQTEELALAFGNRSAAWFYLGDFKNSLEDILQAIRNGYPVSTRYKLDLRSAHCYFQLGSMTDASEALQEFSSHLTEDKTLSEKRKGSSWDLNLPGLQL